MSTRPVYLTGTGNIEVDTDTYEFVKELVIEAGADKDWDKAKALIKELAGEYTMAKTIAMVVCARKELR